MKLTRRAMIKDGLLVVSAGMVMPAIFSRGVSSARAQALDGSHIAQSANDRTLIVVQMAGGNYCHWILAWDCIRIYSH